MSVLFDGGRAGSGAPRCRGVGSRRRAGRQRRNPALRPQHRVIELGSRGALRAAGRPRCSKGRDAEGKHVQGVAVIDARIGVVLVERAAGFVERTQSRAGATCATRSVGDACSTHPSGGLTALWADGRLHPCSRADRSGDYRAPHHPAAAVSVRCVPWPVFALRLGSPPAKRESPLSATTGCGCDWSVLRGPVFLPLHWLVQARIASPYVKRGR